MPSRSASATAASATRPQGPSPTTASSSRLLPRPSRSSCVSSCATAAASSSRSAAAICRRWSSRSGTATNGSRPRTGRVSSCRSSARAASRSDGRDRYTRPAMTHVFVAPHPDDVALSCGGLIASLRELGQQVTILTVFSGTGDADGDLSTYQREALGFGSKALWPNTESFNRSAILADYPSTTNQTATLPAWAATDDRLEATQTDADAAAKRFWQRSSWYRRASIRNESLAGQLVMDVV